MKKFMRFFRDDDGTILPRGYIITVEITAAVLAVLSIAILLRSI